MTWYTIVPTLLVLLGLLILITKLSIQLLLVFAPHERQVLLRVRVWFVPITIDVLQLLEKRKQKKQEEPKREEEELEQSLSQWLDRLPDLIKSAGDIHTILKGFLRKIKVKQFLWSSHIGTGDAASTGIVAGQVWSIKGIVAGMLYHYMRIVREPKLEVHPVFQGTGFATRLECTVSFRIGQAMLAAIKLLRYIRKHRSVFIRNVEQLQQ